MEDYKPLSDEEVRRIGAESPKTRNRTLIKGAKAGESQSYMELILAKWDKDGVNISDTRAVKRRIKAYFASIHEADVKPTLMGVCNSLGITKTTFQEWLRGKNCTKEHRDIAQKAMGVLEEFWEMSIVNGKISADVGKFLGERQFGYTPVSEIIITPNNPLDANKTEDELKRLYGDNDVNRMHVIEAENVIEKE